jgi:hypothetical protein
MTLPARDSAPSGASLDQRIAALLATGLDGHQAELERAVHHAAAANGLLADLYLFSCLRASQALETSGRVRETTTSLTPAAQAGFDAFDQDLLDGTRTLFRMTSSAVHQSVVQALAPESPQQARGRHAGEFLEGILDVLTFRLLKRPREG